MLLAKIQFKARVVCRPLNSAFEMEMTMNNSWPLWLKVLLVLPIGIFGPFYLIRNPKNRREWYFVTVLVLYAIAIYFVVLRR